MDDPNSKYEPRFAEEGLKLCKLGATDEQLADFFKVGRRTITRWREVHPEFDQALAQGKVMADMEVANALFHRATGYSHPAVEFVKVTRRIRHSEKRGDFEDVTEIQQVPFTKHYPPDTLAGIYWLNNRQRPTWKQKAPGKEGDTIIDARMQTMNFDMTRLDPEERDALRPILTKLLAGPGSGNNPPD